VVGQLFSILLVHTSLAIPLPLGRLLPAVALSALVNLALLLRLRGTARLTEPAAVALYAYDILQLFYLLALTGGTQNPFAVLLLVPVALAAATLELRSIVAVTGLALAGLPVLTLGAGGLPWYGGPLELPLLYRVGAAAGLAIATVLIAVFGWGLAEAARRRADALHVTQLALAREQQLSAVGGQAAAAAHLLGTPLGTITIIARELVRELPPAARSARTRPSCWPKRSAAARSSRPSGGPTRGGTTPGSPPPRSRSTWSRSRPGWRGPASPSRYASSRPRTVLPSRRWR
jgi:two-component system sensor histidine kinase RegB